MAAPLMAASLLRHRPVARALARLPFRSQLTLVNLSMTGLALLASTLGLIAVQFTQERAATNRTMAQMAQGLANGLTNAVAADDRPTLHDMLSGTRAVDNMNWVDLDAPDGTHLADYRAPGMTAAETERGARLAHGPLAGQAQGGGFGYVRNPVTLNGHRIGLLTIGYRYRTPGQILSATMPVTGLVLVLCMALSFAMAAHVRRLLLVPLDGLRHAMQSVRDSGDLTARASPGNDPDFAPILSTFNAMLDEVEAQHVKLAGTLAQLAEARDAAQQANVAKSEFLANMSHELRTPLNAIIGYGDVLREDLGTAGMTGALTDIGWICSSSRQLLDMINALLDLSKIEAGRMELDIHAFSLPALMAEVETTLVPLAARHGNTLRVESDPALGMVTGDATRLRQCLLNLGSNACKFTHSGFVTITARAQDHQLVFQIADTGIGMSRSDIDRLFQPFTQSDSSTTRHYGGTGLGLALVDRFMALMQGRIEVTSDKGLGTMFTLSLARDMAAPMPASDSAPPVAATATARPAPRRDRPQALIIEDEPGSMELLRRMLERSGYTPHGASDGETGLEAARATRPDLILLDLNLPRLDGWSLLDLLAQDEVLRDVPTVVVSVDDRKRLSLNKGACAHLVKPVPVDELEAVLALYARRHAGTILLAEDDEATALLYERSLCQAGYGVVRSGSGEEAIAQLALQDFALVLTDLKMPGGDGFALLRALADLPEGRRPPALVITGRPLTPHEQSILSRNAQGMIIKAGLSPRHLVSSVSELLHAA